VKKHYLNILWAWGSATAWRCLPLDLAVGAVEVMIMGNVTAVACAAADEARAYLYSWCMRNEAVS